MRELSIFVDESGDFGPYAKHSPFYIVSMVFHNQATDITDDIKNLTSRLIVLAIQSIRFIQSRLLEERRIMLI